MIIHLDTSVLIDALTGPRRLLPSLSRTLSAGHVIALSAPVLYEWLRGPRTPEDVDDQERLLPSTAARGFGQAEAARAAALYRAIKRPRGRDMDLAIAACALEHGALLWTANEDDFRDIPGLTLYEARVRPGSGKGPT